MGFAIVIGTSGELIKMYPLLQEADRSGIAWQVYSTGQSGINFKQQWIDFGLPPAKLTEVLKSDTDLRGSLQAIKWLFNAWNLPKQHLENHLQRPKVILVHGDTFSTLVGARWAKKLGLPLGHVEAGLRSSHWLQPFPEEINRRVVARHASLHFASSATAAAQLKSNRVKGEIINTQTNTLWDTLVMMLDRPYERPLEKPYIVANIHRFENLKSQRRWAIIVETLKKAGRIAPVYMVLHPSTEVKLNNSGVRKELEKAGVVFSSRMPFSKFIHWIEGSLFVLSDGGSNQEECFYLGKPCLLLRETTEREEGLGANNDLSGFDEKKIDYFLENYATFSRERLRVSKSPSYLIIQHLIKEIGLL